MIQYVFPGNFPGDFSYKKIPINLLTDRIPLNYYIAIKQEAVWQAYHSPASLGFPLSSHRRVDGYEILHLKQPLVLWYLNNNTFISFVKNSFISNQTAPFFFIYFHKGNNGILKKPYYLLMFSI